MEILNNIDRKLGDDLKETIVEGSDVSIACERFSIYAYQALMGQLNKIHSIRFIFTSPTFIKEENVKEKREFYIPRLSRERGIYGTEFEVKLRNELTQKALAKRCGDWIRHKAEFQSNITERSMNNFLNIDYGDSGYSYSGIRGFTTTDLGYEKGDALTNLVNKNTFDESRMYLDHFNYLWNDKENMQNVKDEVLKRISTAYAENSPEALYHVTLYNIFKKYLDELSSDNLPKEEVGLKDSVIWNKLYTFQKDAAMAVINKLETYNGCILADSVGLGKTFTALGVIKYYENRNDRVLVLCPKKLSENWKVFRENYRNNPVAEDRFGYDVLHHTDLLRERGESNGINLARINWSGYQLVVIDESHYFRNGETSAIEGTDNRYQRLLKEVIRKGTKTKVLMLSATPVNNQFTDLYNQLRIAYEGNAEKMDRNLEVGTSIKRIFSDAQGAFNRWKEYDPEHRTTDNLLKLLDDDFINVLDSLTIARSRRHIEQYYGTKDIGEFPKRLPPKSLSPGISETPGTISFSEIYNTLEKLNLQVYMPTNFVLSSKLSKYVSSETNISRAGREKGIRSLISINLLKRLESSIYSFEKTLKKVRNYIINTIDAIDDHIKGKKTGTLEYEIDEDLMDDEDGFNAFEQNVGIKLEDMDYLSWRIYLEEDLNLLDGLLEETCKITPDIDYKLSVLKDEIRNKVKNPINPGNRKILIFSAFADTATYLYDNLADDLKKHGLNVAMITGSADGRNTIKGLRNDFNDILTCFSPVSKDMNVLMPEMKEEIDILIGTDCISEGQNLQDCDYCINYDIHWNPVRIIQRFGRIDRIGSKNDCVQLVNFWPDIELDEYINLKERVETKMKMTVMTSTGDDNVLDPKDEGDLDYRKQQLKRLHNEIVEVEEMQSGISITDLGIHEFRIELQRYVEEKGDLDLIPYGLHAVVPSENNMPPGTIFVLKNINKNVDIEGKNRLHPYYLVYILDDGDVFIDHLSPRKTLELMRHSCKKHTEPLMELCELFNNATNDGKNMATVSGMLSNCINSIVEKKEQANLDCFLKGDNVSFHDIKKSGLDDFELVSFLVVI